ncbi:MAG TPA: hypothetical protein VJB64_03865 [Patescibacteria group bacterium]|nr:hypothetical protein [Patescibacteria group bacterium]
MNCETVSCERDLQNLLARNHAYANGKNTPVAHLYATAATSRFDIENIFGIYLTRPTYAWMALWMAVTNRAVLRKRHLTYYTPQEGDSIGSIGVGGTDLSLEQLLCDQAFLYLFEPDALPKTETDFFPDTSAEEAQKELLARGYSWNQIERRDQTRRTLMPPQDQQPSTIGLDAWQVVCVGVPQLVPSMSVVLRGNLIDSLRGRIKVQSSLPDRGYLIS